MASFAKEKKSGDWVYFVINRYLNPTNLCVLSCSFCDFARKKGEAGAFEHSAEDVVGMIDPDIREVHIVGGHHPDWPFEDYEERGRTIRRERPLAQIKAFTDAEDDYVRRRGRPGTARAVARRRAAGLRSPRGGGAGASAPRPQRALPCPGRAGADRGLEIHRIAHGLGIRSSGTILYGHIETYAERVEHLL